MSAADTTGRTLLLGAFGTVALVPYAPAHILPTFMQHATAAQLAEIIAALTPTALGEVGVLTAAIVSSAMLSPEARMRVLLSARGAV